MLSEQIVWMGCREIEAVKLRMGASKSFWELFTRYQRQEGLLERYFHPPEEEIITSGYDGFLLVGDQKTISSAKEIVRYDSADMLITCYLDSRLNIQTFKPAINECAILFNDSGGAEAAVTILALLVACLVFGDVCLDYADLKQAFLNTTNRAICCELDTNSNLSAQAYHVSNKMKVSKSVLCSCYVPTEYDISIISELADIIYPLCSDEAEVFFSVVRDANIKANTMKAVIMYN